MPAELPLSVAPSVNLTGRYRPHKTQLDNPLGRPPGRGHTHVYPPLGRFASNRIASTVPLSNRPIRPMSYVCHSTSRRRHEGGRRKRYCANSRMPRRPTRPPVLSPQF